MPQLSESMEEGTILKWLVEEGGEVKKGEPLVEIETDKANSTYDAETDGKLEEILAKEGETLPVGEPIARLGGADGDGGQADADDEAEAETPNSAAEHPDERDPAEVKASPVAERVAEEEGVELEAVEGSGPGGRVTKADVEVAGAERKRPGGGARGDVEITELTRLQQNVSRRMAESKATAPDYSLTVDVDMTLAVELRERLSDAEHPPSTGDMVIKATANALREHPRVNGAYRDGKFEQYSRVNIGISLAAQGALVVPTIFDADSKSLGQIARDALELTEKVREGKITPPELAGGTFTISNLGTYGIDEFTAVINPPQAAILAVGAVTKRPAVGDNGRVVAREQVRLTLVSDQRILYGADAAEFLARVRELLESPLQLAL
jgi:pyruvate dehydrogenase E2 component (dihydrolipoamide acetyltransferase)